jgi:hypothetical protein
MGGGQNGSGSGSWIIAGFDIRCVGPSGFCYQGFYIRLSKYKNNRVNCDLTPITQPRRLPCVICFIAGIVLFAVWSVRQSIGPSPPRLKVASGPKTTRTLINECVWNCTWFASPLTQSRWKCSVFAEQEVIRTHHLEEYHLLASCHLLARWFAELFFDPEDGGDTFLWNVGCNSTDYTASYPRRWYSS